MEKLIPELFFPLLKRHQQSYTFFLDLSWFLGGPNLENQAKTLHCRQKSKVPPFLKKRELFTKRWKNDTQSDPEKQQKAIQNATGEPLETHSKKTGQKTPKKLEKNLCWHRNGKRVKRGGLQRDGLRAVLATGVVFGRACGAASTTLANDKKN